MKIKNIFFALKILIAIGWVAFFIYNLSMVRFVGNEYNKDPSNFVFFDDQQHKEAYKQTYSQSPIGPPAWIDEASLTTQCKPAVYMNDFYFNKIDPVVRWMFLLIILTIAIRIPFPEWRQMNTDLQKLSEKFGDEEEDDPIHKKIGSNENKEDDF